ncbi:MAG TPA: Uma2 family endonuclease [Nostocaceae cyanobacterium]|nr:Uma2 family endonuclease [Nostocaceae cyanobacterium]
MVLQTDKHLTLQEFLHLPPGQGDITYELINGQAVPKMSPKFFHAKLTFVIANLIYPWSQNKGVICPEWSVILTKNGQDWVPTPDLLYISHQRLPQNWNENAACPVPPELVIEIISPGQTFGGMTEKAQNYIAAKVSRVWVVDIEDRSITIFYPDAPPQTYRGDELITDVLFPGLEFTVNQLFKNANIPLT